MSDSKPTNILENLVQEAAHTLNWSSYNNDYITALDGATSEQKAQILEKLIKHGLVTRKKEMGHNSSTTPQYIAGSELEAAISHVHEERQYRQNAEITKRSMSYAQRDGFASIADWVAANIPYHIVDGAVCISNDSATKPLNREMLVALDLISDDFTRLSYTSEYQGMRYLATNELAGLFLEKGRNNADIERAGNVVRVKFTKPAPKLAILDGAIISNNIIRFPARTAEKE